MKRRQRIYNPLATEENKKFGEFKARRYWLHWRIRIDADIRFVRTSHSESVSGNFVIIRIRIRILSAPFENGFGLYLDTERIIRIRLHP